MGLEMYGYAYAGAVTLGGVVGYAKAGSIASLGAGILFGCILGVGAYQISQNPQNVYLTLVTSGILSGIMGSRYISSGKIMPAGVVTVMSLGMMVKCGHKLIYPEAIEK